MTQQAEADLAEWKSWDEDTKKRFLQAVEAEAKKKLVWYCMKGRSCDGEEHDQYDYPHARGDQWPPPGEDWLVWLLRGGRGSGKTRSGAEWTRKLSETIHRVSIIGPTLPHVREVMVEGDSGLLACYDAAKVPALWEPSKRRITVTGRSGKEHFVQAFTAEEPERLRGPQHGAVWFDEPAHMKLIQATWDNMMFGLRLGKNPRICCTTTPLPIKWLKDLIAEPDTISTTASTYANMKNLAPTFKKVMLAKYEGTRLGQQELYGEILDDVEGALWTWDMIEDNRYTDGLITANDMDRIVVSIDPAGTSDKKRDETGIVVIGKMGTDFYVLADKSGHYTPEGWASAAWAAYDEFSADKIVAEKNYGGEMVLSTLVNSRKNQNGTCESQPKLVHSRRGKKLRAEPVVGLYEQERVHHMGNITTLEEQMTEWVPDQSDSPDRVDALVHGIVELSGISYDASIAVPKGTMSRAGMGNRLWLPGQ